MKVTVVGEDGEVTVTEASPELEASVDALREAWKDVPWCKCGSDADHWVYFEHQYGIGHGWKCRECDGVAQAG